MEDMNYGPVDSVFDAYGGIRGNITEIMKTHGRRTSPPISWL